MIPLKRAAPAAIAVLCGVALAGLSTVWPTSAAEADTTVGPSQQQLLAQRGGALRSEITSTFRQLRDTRALRFHSQGGNDVTAVVLKYIPLGSPMTEAVDVLSAARYTLGVRGDGQVFARAELGNDFPNLKRSEIEILLKPTDRTPSATLTELRAEIFRRPTSSDTK